MEDWLKFREWVADRYGDKFADFCQEIYDKDHNVDFLEILDLAIDDFNQKYPVRFAEQRFSSD